MAKRDNETTRTNDATTTANAIEQRVLAFAGQLGRIAGTLQAKAEGWMDRDALTKQVAHVRDGAAELLEHLAGGVTKASDRPPAPAPALGKTRRRSGGVVDAPGKKHRKPMPTDPRANIADSQAAQMRTAKTMVKTNRRRGRG